MSNTGYTHLQNENVLGSVPAVTETEHVVLPFPDSNLQTFSPSETRGKLTGTYQPPTDADDSFSKPLSGVNQDGEPKGWQRFFSVTRFSPYFDVDTSDVLERIRDSLLPYKGDFVEKVGHNPDIYGPFWICTTLIFVAAALGNFASYLSHKLKDESWKYDINKVTWSAGMFYGYGFVVPLVFYFALNYFGVTSGLVQLWCLYGYSLFIFIPASFLSAVPIEIFRWVIVGVAGFASATFLALNMRSHIKSQSDRWLIFVTISFLLQVGMALVLKLYFFTTLFD
ncbi:hypothetical protein KP509_05G102000 [Ceratopteris richardii]|uniref:Protein YIP n=1 Tax=Ceratopteris richardii TaxID=49495 RepID=A0A8T2UWD1_CERRI|nr:hypothetical protein KP509_05G102000 [Ceratopteris richardii]KAH7438034.1 hypothetical protein KP509_05G102000 [Ceratopteris richardii]